MILQALNNYYDRLAQELDSGISPIGFSSQNIAFEVVLKPDGTLEGIHDKRETSGKKRVARPRLVLGNSKPSGSGINPGFLWDNPAYMLGYKPDDAKPDRTRTSFEAFRQRHLDAEQDINDLQFSAVCRFLKQWDPALAETHQTLVDIATGFGVFRIAKQSKCVHDAPAVREWWLAQQQPEPGDDPSSSAIKGTCLVTGRPGRLARLHEPKIKGVREAQSSGAALVSFNLDAFESYGKSQSINAPVGEVAAFSYCTALNNLLADESRRRQIGDATTIFWTDTPSIDSDLAAIFGDFSPGSAASSRAEDLDTRNLLSDVLREISLGKRPTVFTETKTQYYILGLSPNAARLSVRFWYTGSLDELLVRLQQHYADLALVRGPRDPEFLFPWNILRETVREAKDIAPLLAGGLMRAILTGGPYPQLLLAALTRRIRADRELRYPRIAAIKAYLNRSIRLQNVPLQEIPMSLDPDRPDPAYRLGRLFAQLEKVQEDALPGLNATIRDRYFSAASATPASVFPRLIRLHQHHLGKLEPRSRTYHSRQIQAICAGLENFPNQLNLREQGLFAIGYYHQRQDLYTKKSTVAATDDDTTNTTSQE